MEPTNTVAGGVVFTVWLATLVPGVDSGALIGAFAGSVVFVLKTKDTQILPRLIYALVALVIGYMAVPSIAALSSFKDSVVIAYTVSAFLNVVTWTLMDRIKGIDVRAVWDALVSVFKKGA